MQAVVERRHAGVVAVDRQQVLDQVVGADGQEVGAARKRRRLQGGRGHLHHHADRRAGDRAPLVAQLRDGAVDDPDGLVDLPHVAHHGQQHLQVAEGDVRPQHGAQLGVEDLGLVEGDPDPAPAEERVVFLDGEVGQRLVAADVERAHHHRLRGQRGQHVAVVAEQLLLAREGVADHVGELGAVEPDPFGAALEAQLDVGHQSRVDLELHRVAVGGARGQVPQLAQPRGQDLLVPQQALEFHHHPAVRAHVDPPLVAVDDDRRAVDATDGQVSETHHRRHAECAGQDCGVGEHRAAAAEHARQLAGRDLREVRRGDLLPGQHAVLRIATRLPRLGL